MAFELFEDMVSKAKKEATQKQVERKVVGMNDNLTRNTNPFKPAPIQNNAYGSKSATLSTPKANVNFQSTVKALKPSTKPVAQGLQASGERNDQFATDMKYVGDTSFMGFAGALDGLKNLPLTVATSYSKHIEPHMNSLYGRMLVDGTSPVAMKLNENKASAEDVYKAYKKNDVWFLVYKKIIKRDGKI